MSDISATPIKEGQPVVPVIERRQGKSSAHRMCIGLPQPIKLHLSYRNALPKLQTITPGKELPQRENKRDPKIIMDPEFQELQVFKELGFEFSKDRLTPRVPILLPELKRLIDHEKSNMIKGFQELASEKSELPNPNVAVLDLKEYLKLWARSVASTLKC